MEQLKLSVPEYNVTDDVDDDDQKTWTQQPYAKMTQIRKTDVVCIFHKYPPLKGDIVFGLSVCPGRFFLILCA